MIVNFLNKNLEFTVKDGNFLWLIYIKETWACLICSYSALP